MIFLKRSLFKEQINDGFKQNPMPFFSGASSVFPEGTDIQPVHNGQHWILLVNVCAILIVNYSEFHPHLYTP